MKKSKLDSLADKLYWPLYAVILAVLLIFTFKNLGEFGVENWDEARHGISSYEMLKSGNPIVNTFRYEPDYWNLKPVLSFWPTLLSFSLFGVSNFTMRLTSALAFVAAGLILARFSRRQYGRVESLIIFSLYTVNTPFYSYHFARSGDADSLYCLFFLCSVLCLIRARETGRFFHWSALFFALAFLTKSWHSGVLLVIILFSIVLTDIKKQLTPREFLKSVGFAVIPIAAWIALRASYDGLQFFTKSFSVDVVERIEGFQSQPMLYCWQCLTGVNLFAKLFAVIALSAFLYFTLKERALAKNAVPIVLALFFFVPFIAYSLSRTEYFWYIYPCYYPLFIAMGVGLAKLLRLTASIKWQKLLLAALKIAATACFAGVIFTNGMTVYSKISNPSHYNLEDAITASMSGTDRYDGYAAYTYALNGYWEQRWIYVAESQADLICRDGGPEAFVSAEGENALLFINVLPYAEFCAPCELYKYDIVFQNDDFIVLARYE